MDVSCRTSGFSPLLVLSKVRVRSAQATLCLRVINSASLGLMENSWPNLWKCESDFQELDLNDDSSGWRVFF